MVDLGINRTQDIQNPMATANLPSARVAAETQDHPERTAGSKAPAKAASKAENAPRAPADLEGEVNRLNDLLGSNTRIQFVVNRNRHDVYVEVVDKTSNKVLKTIPPGEVPGMAEKLSGGGILVDKET